VFESSNRVAGCFRINAVTFRELGPPDLCHIIKSNPKANPKEVYKIDADWILSFRAGSRCFVVSNILSLLEFFILYASRLFLIRGYQEESKILGSCPAERIVVSMRSPELMYAWK
jgi:hypothetical protein